MSEYKKEIRFTITNQCNYNCIFCHNEGMCKKDVFSNQPDINDYGFITDIATRCFGINKFVITGGEPLLVNNVVNIAKSIKSNGAKHITLVSNGSLLSRKKSILKYIDELHISFGTMNRQIYQFRTNSNVNPKQIEKELRKIVKVFQNVKLNVVMLDFENTDCGNILELIELAKELEIELYLIEYFPESEKYYFSFRNIEKLISSLGYKRSREEENKVLFLKKDSPVIKIVFVPCAFVESPLVSNPEAYCKKNQAMYILPDLSIQTCFINKEVKINLYETVKQRDEGGLIRLLKIARAQIGCNCPLTF
jgi:GTP 3',8-cyclase